MFLILTSLQILGTPWLMVNGFCPGPNYQHSKISETHLRGSETETGILETELRVHRIHDTLEQGLQIIPRSLVASHDEGTADLSTVKTNQNRSGILMTL